MRLLVIGAGGHAKVVIDAARLAGFQVAAVLGVPGDPPDVLGHPVTLDPGSCSADGFVVAIGDNEVRMRRLADGLATGLPLTSVVHPSAVIGSDVTLGAGTFVAAGAVVNPCASVGRNAILNTGCTVDHDCVVGDHALVGPQAAMCGTSTIGEGVTLGAGSSLIPGVHVGDWSVVGAGSAVVDDLPGSTLFAGTPARALRTLARPR